MAIFDSNTIVRFSNQGENEFATNNRCIIDRYCIPIVSGTAEYLLPNYITDIRRVTYKGLKIYPASHRSFRDSQVSVSSMGKPTEYIYNNIGQNSIKFFPAPNETISAVQTNLFGTEIPDRVIVEFYRVPDHLNFKLPTFFRRRLLKAYALKMCFLIEGKGQDLKAASYWDKKWTFLSDLYGELLNELINSPRRLLCNETFLRNATPQRPRLPIDRFGIGVNTGE